MSCRGITGVAALNAAAQARTPGLRRPRPWRFVGVGVLVAVLVIVSVGPQGLLLPRSTVCRLGSAIGSYTVFTLVNPLNQPPGVGVWAESVNDGFNFTFVSGSLTVGAIAPWGGGGGWGVLGGYQAGITAQGIERNWTVYSTTNTSVIGQTSGPCTQPYVAMMIGPPVSNCGGFVNIPLANESSDLVEPHVWNGSGGQFPPTGCPPPTPGASIWFDISFHPNGTGPYSPVDWNLCNSSGNLTLYVENPGVVPIVLSVPYNGRTISIVGVQTWGAGTGGLYTAQYTVPAGWIWRLAPIGPSTVALDPASGNVVPNLLAFERLACP